MIKTQPLKLPLKQSIWREWSTAKSKSGVVKMLAHRYGLSVQRIHQIVHDYQDEKNRSEAFDASLDPSTDLFPLSTHAKNILRNDRVEKLSDLWNLEPALLANAPQLGWISFNEISQFIRSTLAKKRPADFAKQTPEQQWAIDKELGLLDVPDWPIFKSQKEFNKYLQEISRKIVLG